MKEISPIQIFQLLNENKLNYFNFYNVDLSVSQYYTVKYFLENPHDTIDKKFNLPTFVLDIEVYTEGETNEKLFEDGAYPIASVSTYFEDKYKVFFLGNISINIDDIKKLLKEEGYIDNDINLEVKTYNNEEQLLIDLWSYIRECDPIVLTGYNSDFFDYPYLFRRLIKLFGEDQAKKIISRFGAVEFSNKVLKIADYTVIDVLYLLKPRSEGGRGYGSSYESYSLDDIAKVELGLGKVSHDISLDDLYLADKFTYLYYNLVDVILTSKLIHKFNHIMLHVILSRLMRCTITESLRGISIPIDTFIFYELSRKGKYVRYGINKEKELTIEKKDIERREIPELRDKRGKYKPATISGTTFLELTSIYPGAYVKEPKPGIIKNKLIIDLDASSLYPSMILQHNISFDSFVAQIIDPAVYKLLDILLTSKVDKQLLEKLYQNISYYVLEYVDKKGGFANKTSALTNIYYILTYLLSVVSEYKPFEKILNPTTTKESILLRNYLIPMINLFSVVHTENTQEYNEFIYDYIFNEEVLDKKYKHVYIIVNPFSSNTYIKRFTLNEVKEFLSKYCFTISGAVFTKHENKLGLFTDIIYNLRQLRSQYKKIRDSYVPDSEEYSYYDSMQTSVKINANSIYGAFGLSVFRYSSSYLAKAITCQGRCVNKIAQYLADQFITLMYNK